VLDVDEAVIDGEVIAIDESGRPQFYELLRSASYVAFDVLWAGGTDLRSLPLDERRRRLQGILPKDRRSFPTRSPSRAGGANSSR
jgi:bifunctional non-homologous end joining protein LigD